MITRRLTVRAAVSELFNAITNVERGLLFTIKEMTLRPGIVISDYIQGKTRPYFPPFRFAFILITLTTVLTIWTGVFEEQQMAFAGMGGEVSPSQRAFQEEFSKNLEKYLNLTILILLPFYSLSTWLITRKKGYNFAEHFLANTFVVGQSSFYGLFLIPIYALIPGMGLYSIIVSLGIHITLLTLIFRQWMQIEWGESFALGFVATLLSYITMIAFMMILGIIITIIVLFLRSGGESPALIPLPHMLVQGLDNVAHLAFPR